jgi:hypothetical protein
MCTYITNERKHNFIMFKESKIHVLKYTQMLTGSGC